MAGVTVISAMVSWVLSKPEQEGLGRLSETLSHWELEKGADWYQMLRKTISSLRKLGEHPLHILLETRFKRSPEIYFPTLRGGGWKQ